MNANDHIFTALLQPETPSLYNIALLSVRKFVGVLHRSNLHISIWLIHESCVCYGRRHSVV